MSAHEDHDYGPPPARWAEAPVLGPLLDRTGRCIDPELSPDERRTEDARRREYLEADEHFERTGDPSKLIAVGYWPADDTGIVPPPQT